VHIRPDHAADHKRLLVGFGGNAWNGQDVGEYLHELFPDDHVVVFHYRGYSPSTGSPSGEALIGDAPLVYDLAAERVKPRQIVAVGFSIGSAVAATLAGARSLDGLILVTPFDSLKALAQGMFPWVPIGPFFEHQIDAAEALERSPVPVAIIAAGKDEIVASARTDALRSRVNRVVFDRTIAGAGHNDIYVRSDFHEAMRDALAAVTSAPRD
jgi:pimeloyl-ACP methyl ester carboxylesterase